MAPSKSGFNRVLDDLARRQLHHDFQFGSESCKYEPQRHIGAGAFGIVCEAIETTSKHSVAIKKIGHASATPTLARRTLREIRVLRYVKHPNIISLRDIFRTPGPLGINVFLIMELMDGSLHDIIHGSNTDPLEDDLIAHFLFQLLRGLRYLHSAGIAHRDLKPSNLLINTDCTLRIADFGMAKLAIKDHIEEAEEHCFYMTQHVATLPYRAPELLYVLPEHSTSVDMWAVGCIFAEMFLRRELFPGRSVSGQIKIILSKLGTPSQTMIDEIRCERTKRLIETSEYQQMGWREILFVRDRQMDADALDLVSRLCVVDVDERMDVHEAVKHPFIRKYFANIPAEPSCPFRVKMDMAAVESLNHKALTDLLKSDVKSAECRIYAAEYTADGRINKSFQDKDSSGSGGTKHSSDCSSPASSIDGEKLSRDRDDSGIHSTYM